MNLIVRPRARLNAAARSTPSICAALPRLISQPHRSSARICAGDFNALLAHDFNASSPRDLVHSESVKLGLVRVAETERHP